MIVVPLIKSGFVDFACATFAIDVATPSAVAFDFRYSSLLWRERERERERKRKRQKGWQTS